MPSNINSTNINGNFPVAGQDNDSQGFRDNFTNLKVNLTYAKSEIEDLQSKVMLKSALTGTTLQNDLSYAVVYRPQIKAEAIAYKDLGTVTNVITVSFLDGGMQKLTTSGPLTINLANFPQTGLFGSIRLWMNITFGVSQVLAAVTLPNNVNLGTNLISGYNNTSKAINFTSIGDHLFEISTVDGGTNYWILQLA